MARKFLLYGGRKPREAIFDFVRSPWPEDGSQPIKLGKRGLEGQTFEGQLVFNRGKSQRTKAVAVKVFDEHTFGEGYSYGLPEKQLKIYNELKELNRRRKLGIHLLPFVRLLRRERGKHYLVEPNLQKNPDGRLIDLNYYITNHLLPAEARGDYLKDMERQTRILAENGYLCVQDAFVPVKDRKHNVFAMILDLGGIKPADER